MALPTLSKTWQISANNTVTAQGTAAATDQYIWWVIKNLLIGFGTLPWVVRGSSNSSTAGLDAVDRWTTSANIVKATSGSPHSWIVLRQTGIATNFELCIDANHPVAYIGSIIVSPSAGFTGGTTTARPTATDEIVLISTTTWSSNADTQHQVHAWQSTDGACTIVQVWRGGSAQPTFLMFVKPNDPPTGWSNPSLSVALGNNGGGISAPLTTFWASAGSPPVRARGSVGTINVNFGGEAATTGGNLAVISMNAASAFSGEWPFYPVGATTFTSPDTSRLGVVPDLWWKANAVLDGDTFPNNASTRQFVAAGGFIFPWLGDSTQMLLV